MQVMRVVIARKQNIKKKKKKKEKKRNVSRARLKMIQHERRSIRCNYYKI